MSQSQSMEKIQGEKQGQAHLMTPIDQVEGGELEKYEGGDADNSRTNMVHPEEMITE